MKKIIYSILAFYSATVLAGPFDSYVATNADKKSLSTLDSAKQGLSNSLDAGLNRLANTLGTSANPKDIIQVVPTPTTQNTVGAISQPTTIEEIRQKQQQEYVRSEIERKKTLLSVLKAKMQFVKKEKKIFLKPETRYLDVFIPFNNQSIIKFDQKIKEISFLQQDNIIINKIGKNEDELELLNKNPELLLNVKITFLSDQQITLVLQTGKSSTKRYVDYKIFANTSSLAAKTLFIKPTKIRTIHNDFNNKSMYLILSRLTKNDFYKKLRENIVKINEILFSGQNSIETLYGLQSIDYTLLLNNVYESPFIQSSKDDADVKKRLILMELTLTNNHKSETLTVNETLIKNRFGNLVAVWLGNLDDRENVLSPSESLRFLLVIEDKVQNET
jgi:hypothetical protein